MFRQAEPGLGHRGPERPVVVFRRHFGHAKAIFGIATIVVRGAHATIPKLVSRTDNQAREMGKVEMVLRRDRGHSATVKGTDGGPLWCSLTDPYYVASDITSC